MWMMGAVGHSFAVPAVKAECPLRGEKTDEHSNEHSPPEKCVTHRHKPSQCWRGGGGRKVSLRAGLARFVVLRRCFVFVIMSPLLCR